MFELDLEFPDWLVALAGAYAAFTKRDFGESPSEFNFSAGAAYIGDKQQFEQGAGAFADPRAESRVGDLIVERAPRGERLLDFAPRMLSPLAWFAVLSVRTLRLRTRRTRKPKPKRLDARQNRACRSKR